MEELDPLDIPRTIPEIEARARKLGIPVSRRQLYRYARTGQLPVSRIGCMRTTMRAVIDAFSPVVE